MNQQKMGDGAVLLSRRGALAIATLNLPKALNALNLEMIDLLSDQLDKWAEDDRVAAVWIDGSGDRAFCSGGDVVALYRESAAYGETTDFDQTTGFFSREYRLDYKIHTYKKPILVWGGGLVMGGGIGIMAGASHRIVTETTRMAMPEITIGLFPDVGGSWFLNRMPGRLGLFLGLTGTRFNGGDALFAGMAERMLADGRREVAQAEVAGLDFSGDKGADQRLIDGCLERMQLPEAERSVSNLRQHYEQIQQLTDFETLPEVCRSITAYKGGQEWLRRAATTLATGSPLTPWIVWEQLRRGRRKSLAEVFHMELVLAVNVCASGHFREGVRALLIDKDRAPQWQPATLEEITAEQVEACFKPPWAGENPLSDL